MDVRIQAEKAERFRKLHGGPNILALPNAWDVASARILEEARYPAIATSSAGVAFSLGYPDGQRVSRDQMLEVVGRIAHAVRVPVTADMEAGYGTTVKDMEETAKAVIAAGAIGMNLEDATGDDESSQVDTEQQVEKIRAIRAISSSHGVSLVLNARTDIYLMPIGEATTRFERTVERLRAYCQAGADCVFAPGVSDRDTIAELVKAIAAPLNILISPNCPSLTETGKDGSRTGKRRLHRDACCTRARSADWERMDGYRNVRFSFRWRGFLCRFESDDGTPDLVTSCLKNLNCFVF